MKKMLLGLGIGMAGGMSLATYILANPNTRKNADKMLNKAMNNASMAMDDMKETMKCK